MNKYEIEQTAALIRRFADEHTEYLSSTSMGHVIDTAVILDTIGMVAPDDAPRPSHRVNGMCPCELSDQAKRILL